MTNELNALGPFEAISNADVRRMLEFEAEKQKLGCDGTDASCLAEIGGALGAAYLVAGQVLKVEDTWLVQLQLFSIEAAKPMGRAAREYRGDLRSLDRREQDLALIDAGTYAALSAGLLSAGAAVVLFIVGDDPGRYAAVGEDAE